MFRFSEASVPYESLCNLNWRFLILETCYSSNLASSLCTADVLANNITVSQAAPSPTTKFVKCDRF